METLIYLKELYKFCLIDAFRRCKSSLVVLVGICCLLSIWVFTEKLFMPLGIAGGFLRALLEAACLTFYFSWIRDSYQQSRVKLADLKEFDWGLFQSIISVLFIIFLMQWVVSMLLTGIEGRWIFIILQLLIVLLLNCLPEVICISRNESLSAIQESFNFTYKNWIEWYIPILVLLAPISLDPSFIASALAEANVMLPTSILIEYPAMLLSSPALMIVSIPVLLLFSHFFMLFRFALYSELEGSNRRQRIFKSKSR